MKFETPKNVNYSATIVALKDFVDLAGCDNVKAALIFGNSVIVSKSCAAGELGVFFPVEAQLSPAFLGQNNLYRKPELGNIDPLQKGFFENHGRVKAMKFRGHKSEGFWIPISSLTFTGVDVSKFEVGDIFDKIGTFEICQKYIPKHNPAGLPRTKGKVARLADSIVDGQFRFHFDTEHLRRNIHKIQPTDYISISSKWHGTSAIISKILVKRNLNWFEKLLVKTGVDIRDTNYGLTYSSRKVIKAVNGIDKSNGIHFYGEDIWGIVAKEVEDKLPNSFTLYGEIVGFMPTGSPIQSGPGGKPYSYDCERGQHRFMVYRVVTTNADGKTFELPWLQMKEFCHKYGLEMVKELFYGQANELVIYDGVMDIRDWQDKLLKTIEFLYVTESMCAHCNFEVPEEGVVVRVDHLEECQSYKLKNFKFLEAETKLNDEGVVDTETLESEEESNA